MFRWFFLLPFITFQIEFLFLPQSDLYNYNPQPVDMTNLTLSREMQNMAERLAENAHDIWAKRKVEELEACGEWRT